MAATTDLSLQHPTRCTRPQPPTHQHDATTRLARPHNHQPTATHPDPARKATNPVTVTPQHGAQDYNLPPPSPHHTPQHGNTASNTATANPPPRRSNTMQRGTQGYNPPPQTHHHAP
ncbi:hypothetical protein EDB89DRAFT_1911097 [Lactarius sanguifluus]|nr:hypothetical protein EDB89DRAFT_1911097 [Lactarius sanguifluus]